MNALARIQIRRRATLEVYIEQMIALLDHLDGDPDLEDGADREEDHAERGLADRDALDLFVAEGGIFDNLSYDGSGQVIALQMLRRIGRQLESRAHS